MRTAQAPPPAAPTWWWLSRRRCLSCRRTSPSPAPKIVWVDPDPVQSRYKTMEFHADAWLPVLAGPFAQAVYEQEMAGMLTKADMGTRIEDRRARLAERKSEITKQAEDAAWSVSKRNPISPRWVGRYQVGQVDVEREAIVLDDTLSSRHRGVQALPLGRTPAGLLLQERRQRGRLGLRRCVRREGCRSRA